MTVHRYKLEAGVNAIEALLILDDSGVGAVWKQYESGIAEFDPMAMMGLDVRKYFVNLDEETFRNLFSITKDFAAATWERFKGTVNADLCKTLDGLKTTEDLLAEESEEVRRLHSAFMDSQRKVADLEVDLYNARNPDRAKKPRFRTPWSLDAEDRSNGG